MADKQLMILYLRAGLMFVLFLFFCHCERNIKKLEAEKQYNGLITDPLVRHVSCLMILIIPCA